jgi:colanic acid/amylovoran biosynthesis glycosyltransferase
MRIAYLVNHYPKVSHTFIRREILALERRGVEVVRVAMRGWDGELVDAEDVQEQAKTAYVLNRGPMPLLAAMLKCLATRPSLFVAGLQLALRMSRGAERPLWVHLIYFAEACHVLGIVQAAQVEHVHAHFGTNPAEVAMLVQALGGPSYSFTVHGPEEFDKPAFIGMGEKIRRARFVVAISAFGGSQLRRWVGYPDWPKIKIVHCGLESAFHDNVPETDASLMAAPTLVCVGRICEQKGQLLLIEAAAKLRAQGCSFNLVLAGDGEMRAEVEALIAQHDLAKHVRITGWISSAQVRDELLAARTMVLPSFAEGLPVVIMEAMALRRPVLSTYVAGIPELVISGENGWLVPAGDVDALAASMRVALETPVERLLAMGEAARTRVLQRHSIDTEAAKLAEYFADAASVGQLTGASHADDALRSSK